MHEEMGRFQAFPSRRFHTHLLEEEEGQVGQWSLRLRREQIDNPHKEKTWKVFREQFRIAIFAEKI